MELQQRLDRAAELHAQGYNCAQSVAMACADLTDMTAEQLSAIAAPFGAGFGANGQLCGAVAGMGMIYGLTRRPKPSEKKIVYDTTRALTDEFVRGAGSIVCRELKGSGKRPCSTLIADAVTIIHNHLNR